MNLIFTCGGTAGHINPAIAVANMMKERHPGCNILFIGATGHMEEKLVPKAGYELRCLPASGLSRKITLGALKKNLHAVKCVLGAVDACKKIIREFQPDVILGTGGYASFPALYAGSVMEYGDVYTIFGKTMHPYTHGLINATPSIIRSASEIEPIPGSPPDIRNLPEGCPFHPRCKHATEKCRVQMPESMATSDSHIICCHLFDGNRGGESL